MVEAQRSSRRRRIRSAREAALVLGVLVRLPRTLYDRDRLALPDLVRRYEHRAVRPVPHIEPDRLVVLVRGLLRRLGLRDFCVPQSLLVFRSLTAWSLPARIVFGVQKHEQGLHGHAWVEVAGRVVGEETDPRQQYHVTYAYPDL